jgi:hypothetical protein
VRHFCHGALVTTKVSEFHCFDYRSLRLAGGLNLRKFGSFAPLALERRFIIGRFSRGHRQFVERNSAP